MNPSPLALALLPLLIGLGPHDGPKPGQLVERVGDEIIACGRLVHATTPIVTWLDPGGYDAYRVERRFVPPDQANGKAAEAAGLRSPNRYGGRDRAMMPAQRDRLRANGWDLPLLQEVVDQFVIHFDARGTSRRCFEVLHDRRGLSVHFLLDLDGTIYQTLDLKEGAWHATIANARSIGIEIANVGAYPPGDPTLGRWYRRDGDGPTRIVLPDDERPRNPEARLRPLRDEPISGTIQGQDLRQYDLTEAQYDALIRLTATLCALFPKVCCDYPRDPGGGPVPRKLADDELRRYQGLLGHYHVQTNKVDPGPAFQWDRVVDGARRLLGR